MLADALTFRIGERKENAGRCSFYGWLNRDFSIFRSLASLPRGRGIQVLVDAVFRVRYASVGNLKRQITAILAELLFGLSERTV